jgi:hypothetical protein
MFLANKERRFTRPASPLLVAAVLGGTAFQPPLDYILRLEVSVFVSGMVIYSGAFIELLA